MLRLTLAIPLALITTISALKVNEPEVKKQSAVKFINNRNQKGDDTVTAIQGIGKELAVDGSYGSYSVIHAVGTGSDKFDADIIVFGKGAKVDHIKNVRRIIAAYLSDKYSYSKEDAKSLAVFVTYYNGFYRKNLGYFKEHYKDEVLGHLSAANAGLDRSYKGWPGKSRIVIPLGEGGKPDPNKIGEKEVMEKVRTDEPGSKDRENITKLQEKETKKKEERVNESRKEIEGRKEKLYEEKKKIEEIKDPGEKAKKEEQIKKDEEKLKKDEQKIAKEEKKVEEQKTQITENKQNIEKDKTREERKNETPAQKESRLEAKEEALKKKEDELANNRKEDQVFGGKLYYLRVRDFSTDGKYRNDFYIIDPKKRKVRVKSPYGGIVGKKFDVIEKDVVVIGERRTATATQHFLVKLDGETLVDKDYGADEVFWRGFVEVRDNEIYAILNKNGTFYLGKFDNNLKLLQRSDIALHEDTFFSFYEDTIYVNGADRKIEVLNRADLKSAGNVIP